MGKGKLTPRATVLEYAAELMNLPEVRGVSYVIAGSIRRGKAIVSDADILVLDGDGRYFSQITEKISGARRIRGGASYAQFLYRGVQFDFRRVGAQKAPSEFLLSRLGSFLLYYTGSGKFNELLRSYAIGRGLKLSEYGLFQRTKDHLLASSTETEIFASLGLRYIPPAQRTPSNRQEFNQLVAAFRSSQRPTKKITIPLLGRVTGTEAISYSGHEHAPDTIYKISPPTGPDVYATQAKAQRVRYEQAGGRIDRDEVLNELDTAAKQAASQEGVISKLRADILAAAKADGLIVSTSGGYLLIRTSLVDPKKIAWHPTVGYVALTRNIPTKGFAKWRDARKFLLPTAPGRPTIKGE